MAGKKIRKAPKKVVSVAKKPIDPYGQADWFDEYYAGYYAAWPTGEEILANITNAINQTKQSKKD